MTNPSPNDITKIDDIGAVVDEEVTDEEDGNISRVKNSRIIGVMNTDTFSSCIKCNAKVVEDNQDPDHSKCVKCQITQCTDAWTKQLSIRVMIKSDNDSGSEHLEKLYAIY